MTLLVDYVQPLTHWLQQNPHWSLFITFLISLTESLAIIGSIVPGSVTMTAIGILAGSGIMRIDLTMLAAIMGAVAGDSISYAIGYVYSERLTEIWPFSKYPKLFQYGKEFFTAHGGKSVLIGRFVGPLRSIIPVIAGIMHMKQWRFLIANLISAIGWSLLYVMPGVIIGAASHELSAESATRLFVLILLALGGIWIVSVVIKWLIIKLNSFLKQHLHDFWKKRLKSRRYSRLYKAITPKNEQNHYTTASLALIALFCFLGFMLLTAIVIYTPWAHAINLPSHLFLQSSHPYVLEAFFIFCNQLSSKPSMLAVLGVCCCWFIYNKKPIAIVYLCSALILSTIFALLLKYWVNSPRPTGLLVLEPGSSFPALNILVATTFYGFILFYVNSIYQPFTNVLRTSVFVILGLSGFAAIYLGDHWITDVLASYLSGATICLICCLVYRTATAQTKTHYAAYFIFSLCAALLITSFISTSVNFRRISYNHTPYRKEFALSEKIWWNQKKPILPIYRLNRIGKRISILNIQYSGSLGLLEEHLAFNGWESHQESFFTNFINWISNQRNGVKLPLLTQLYEKKAPSLNMTYEDPEKQLMLELRVWESNYNLTEYNRPLWIGSVHTVNSRAIKGNTSINPLSYLYAEKNSFSVKKITIPDAMIKSTTYASQPYIVLIKD